MLIPVANLSVANPCLIERVSLIRPSRTFWGHAPTGPYYIQIIYKGNKTGKWWGILSKGAISSGFNNKKTAMKAQRVFVKKINTICNKKQEK